MASQRPSWTDFIRRRFWRIYPPYVFTLVLFSVAYHSDWRQVLSHLFLVHSLATSTFNGINSAFWSVGVEVQLYAAYPLLILLSSRLGWRRTVWLLASLVARKDICETRFGICIKHVNLEQPRVPKTLHLDTINGRKWPRAVHSKDLSFRICNRPPQPRVIASIQWSGPPLAAAMAS